MDTMSWGATTTNCLLAGSSPAHGEQIPTGVLETGARSCARERRGEMTRSV